MDVFFARLADLEAAVLSDNDTGWRDLAAAIKPEKEAYHRDAADRPDWVLGEEPERSVNEPDAQILRGIPGSPGKAEGLICRVLNQDQFKSVPDGAILVARTTNPAWTPLFHIAAGLITESGGPLSHGAVTAREMNIPAIMAVRDALLKLPDGKRVRMNGTSGEIHVVEPHSVKPALKSGTR
jgi:pyruvate,water dikinase